MTDFYQQGLQIGAELGKRRGTALQNAAGFISATDNLEFINGVIDGVREAGETVKGIRVSQEFLHLLRNAPLASANDTYREIPFVEDSRFFPEAAYEFEV